MGKSRLTYRTNWFHEDKLKDANTVRTVSDSALPRLLSPGILIAVFRLSIYLFLKMKLSSYRLSILKQTSTCDAAYILLSTYLLAMAISMIVKPFVKAMRFP